MPALNGTRSRMTKDDRANFRRNAEILRLVRADYIKYQELGLIHLDALYRVAEDLDRVGNQKFFKRSWSRKPKKLGSIKKKGNGDAKATTK